MSVALQRAVNAFVEQIDGPIASFFDSCVHCGLCADACLFYTETGDPRYTPIYKLEPMKKVWKEHYTFWGRFLKALGLSSSLTEDDLKNWEPLLYDSCTLCGRCSMVCPVGNDITYMVRKSKEAMVASGFAPEGLKQATLRAIRIGSPMGITVDAFRKQLSRAEKASGLKINLDAEGVDYLAMLSANEIMAYPEIIEALALIFDQAGVSWTFSTDVFEATNSGLQIGSSDIERQLLKRIVDAAEKLQVKNVISPECGHAYTALRFDGPNLIGRPYGFRVLHILELLDQLRAEGRLKFADKFATPLTYHDPCQIARRGGVVQQPRNLLNMIATDFRETEETGVMNWCCGGGGGVSANERARELMIQVFNKKKSQIQALGVSTLVTACANCRMVLEEDLEENDMEMEVLGLTELLAEHIEK
jgi:Fe-S oxidoreductase